MYNRPADEYWIGLFKDNPYQLPKKSHWYWLDGTPYDESMDLWRVGGNGLSTEPSGHAHESCARIIHDQPKWGDKPCQEKCRFICKRCKCIILFFCY